MHFNAPKLASTNMFCHHLQQKQVVQKRHKSEIMTKKTHRGKDKGKKEKESDGFQQYTF